MATVEINAGGRFVRVIQDGRDAELLMPLAQKAWEATEGAKDDEPEGAAFGFRDERRHTSTVNPLAGGGYGAEPMETVNAKVGNSAHPL